MWSFSAGSLYIQVEIQSIMIKKDHKSIRLDLMNRFYCIAYIADLTFILTYYSTYQ